jgi:hypothetical protein
MGKRYAISVKTHPLNLYHEVMMNPEKKFKLKVCKRPVIEYNLFPELPYGRGARLLVKNEYLKEVRQALNNWHYGL